MQEINIEIEEVDPIEIFGVNNAKIDILRKFFPKLKIIPRGSQIKAMGEEQELDKFKKKFELLIEHFNQFNILSESNIERLMEDSGDEILNVSYGGGEVLVYGPNGVNVKAKTVNQRRLVESVGRNDLVFAIGPAGTGKTYTAVALAVRALKNKEIRRIILTRPAVEAGENLGFLPGDLKEKLDPYLQPLYDGLYDMIPADKLESMMESKVIQIAPLAFMRGRTLDHAFVILDEAQNATRSQLKMFLTRMGAHAKFVITGDLTQIDLPSKQPSGLLQAKKILGGIKGVDFVELDEKDVIRHQIVKRIIKAYDTNEGN